jgi:membrane-associated phospholipid phosphatase
MDWQVNILTWVQSFKTPMLDNFFLVVTISAEEVFIIMVGTWLMWCQNKMLAQRYGLAFITSTVFNPTLKELFAVERPIGITGVESLRVETAPGYSFPSGHTQSAASFWFAASLGIRRKWVSILAVVMITLVAISRLYLGLHWFIDVIAGIIFGLIWVYMMDRLFSFCERKNNLNYLWLVLLPFVVAYLLFPHNKPLIVSFGASIGFLAGIQIERKYIHYQVTGVIWQNLIKFVFGIAVLVLIRLGLKPIMPFPEIVSDLLRYICTGLWISAGAPWLFQKTKFLKAKGYPQ